MTAPDSAGSRYCNEHADARIPHLVGMPRCGGRASLALSIPNDRYGDMVRFVHHTSVCYGKAVSEFSAFVNRSGRLSVHLEYERDERRKAAYMRGETSRRAESFDKGFNSIGGHGVFWIKVGNASFQI